MARSLPLLPTTLVGSYPQPGWLVNRDVLLGSGPPRVRMREVWRVPAPLLGEAQDDAVRLAVADQERAGLDILTDGEARRESYFNRFATALDGVDLDRPGIVTDRAGNRVPVPRVVGKVRRRAPVELEALRFLRRSTDLPIKMTVPGPFTLTQLAVDEHYRDERLLALDYAAAVNEELRELANAGADYLQLDEPYLQARPEHARRYGLEAIERALDGVAATTIIHVCFGYAYAVSAKPSAYSFLPELARCRCAQVSIEAAQPRLDLSVLRELGAKAVLVGVIDLADPSVETAQTVAARLRGALEHIPPERLIAAPDCGMKYLDRASAFGKLRALAEGARVVRAELKDRGAAT